MVRVATVMTGCLLVLGACGGQPEGDRPTPGPESASPQDRVVRGLVPFSKDQQPLFEERATLDDRMRHYGVPGVGVAVIDDFELAWAEGFGVVRAGGEEAVDADTLFHAGSVAKPVSTAAVLDLVDAGVLDLDRDVNEVLTTWKVPESEFTDVEKVTLRRLLSHTAGIEDGLTNRSASDAVPNYLVAEGARPSVTIEDLLEPRPDLDVDGPTRVAAVPGAGYRYANADFAIVELVVRDVTGRDFAPLMREVLLDPLAMSSSTYEQPLPFALRERAAVEHDFSGAPLEGDRLHIPLLAAGGLWTTPSDLARFAIAMMDRPDAENDPRLSEFVRREMLTPQAVIEDNLLAQAMGLGFELSGEGEDLGMVHTGGTWGSTAILWAYPRLGKGVVIMTNSATGSMLRFEILLGVALEYGWPLVE